VAQGYSTSNVFTHVPSSVGSFTLAVAVRSAGSSQPYEAFSTVPFTVTAGAVHIDSVSPMLSQKVPLGQSINWQVQASGGDAPLMFQYWIYDGLGWSLKLDWSLATTFPFTPTRTGRHALSIYAKRSGSTAPYEAYSPNIYFTVDGTDAPDLGSLAYYVDTGPTIDVGKTCNQDYLQRFTGAGLLSEVSYRSPGPIQYQWNFGMNRLLSEKDLFGYQPQYSPDRVSFATNGRPLIRAQDAGLTLQVLGDDGSWSGVSLLQAAQTSLSRQGYTWALGPSDIVADYGAESRIVYDRNCNAYALIDAARSTMSHLNGPSEHHSILMHSMDGGRSWAAYVIPLPDPALPNPDFPEDTHRNTDYAVNMEVPTAGHVLDGPPALLMHPRWYADIQHNRLPATQKERDEHVLELVAPTRIWDGTLSLGVPQRVSPHASTGAGIAGSENYAVTLGDHIYVVYPGDAVDTDPVSGRIGTPAYVTIFTRSNASFTAPVPIGVGVSLTSPIPSQDACTEQKPCVVDDHDQPVVARDSQGYLHVMIGGHNGPMYYRKSLYADSASWWSAPEVVGDAWQIATYTYPSLIIDRSNRPIVAARTSNNSEYAFKAVVMRRETTWGDAITLLDPGKGDYGNWYHKLSLDPWGHVFVSYGYYSDVLYTDEKAILENTYQGWILSLLLPLTECAPTAHDAPVAQRNRCTYRGVSIVSPGVLAADINQSWSDVKFELATSGSFLGIGPRVWVDTANVTNHSVGVAWSGAPGASLNDKIGLFQVGASDDNPTALLYTASCASSSGPSPTAGHCTFNGVATGTYEARLFSMSQSIAGSRQVIVP